jgi:phosphoribosylformylglycinamidine cyclo-ligase
MSKLTYKSAGVDLDRYQESMARLPKWLHRTHTPRVIRMEGGFAGLFQLDFAGRLFARHYSEPVLIACTDGVGTKIKVAQACGNHRTVGIDLVAMSVNDALCCGAEPLLFLDYVAMSRDDPALLEEIVAGISDGCIQADCALLGGETAVMPDIYAAGDYDLAGFCVGVVERRLLIDGQGIDEGDLVLGIASSGFHANGYSLIRKIVFDHAALGVDDFVPELDETVGTVLLRPTRIYCQVLRRVLRHYTVKNVVHGLAHVTGGGIEENVKRILPKHLRASLDRHSWTVPGEFSWLQKLGGIDPAEMLRVFNMGIGMVMIVSPFYANHILNSLKQLDLACWPIGKVVAGEGDVVWT